MKTIHELFWHDLTLRSIKWRPYLDVYEEHFSPWRHKQPTFVEVGVFHGGSLEMWSKYFSPAANIWGIDIDPAASNLNIPNTRIAIGDQGDRNFWTTFLEHVPKIDIFLDDGGHRMDQQIITFECVWPHISENGVYICEDTHTSYWSEYGAVEGQLTFMEYAKKSIDLLNRNHMRTDRPNTSLLPLLEDLGSVCFYDSMVVFRKGRKSFDWCEVNGIS